MDKSFVVEYPVRLDNMNSVFKRNFYYQRIFYQNLFEIMKEENIPYRKVILKAHTNLLKEYDTATEIYLAYHKNSIKRNNAYSIKEAYTLEEMYFDKHGYSGWSEMANNKNLFDETQNVNLDNAKKFVNEFFEIYKKNKLTKYEQSNLKTKLPSKFVLVALQVDNDTVNQLAYIQTYDLARFVLNAYKNSEYSVLIKPHPRDSKFNISKVGCNNNNVVRDSLDCLLPKASAVYTVNSGVGFESLLYGKKVFTAGHNDYHWVTTKVKTFNDIKSNIDAFDVDNDKILKFLYYYLNEYVVKYNDKDKIRNKIIKALKEFKI